jgi:O-antigen ligase
MTLTNSASRKAESVYNIVCIGIAGSLVFWPLLCFVLIIFLSVYWLLFAKKTFNIKEGRYKLVLLFCALYLPVIIGTLYSENLDGAITQLRIKIPFLVLPVIFGCTDILNKRIYNNIFRSFAVFTLAGCVYCMGAGFVNYIQNGSTEQLHGYPLVVLKYMPPFVFAFFCLLSLAYILNEISFARIKKPLHKTISIILLVSLSLFLFLLGNRNILFCWIIVVIFFCFRLIKTSANRILFFIVLVAALIAGIILNPSLNRQWKDMTDFSANNTITLDANRSLGRGWGGKAIRVAIWQCSADILKKNWLAGVGTGDAQDALQNAYEERKFYFASRHNTYNAHDQYLQQTIAFGIAGIVIFLLCLLVPLFLYIRSSQYTLYILFLICFMVICLTDSILEVSKGVVLYSFFNSLFAFTDHQKE